MQLTSIFASALLAGYGLAQTVVPFTVDGPIDDVSATSLTTFNTGGSIKVYGDSITIPDNLIVQFPAAWVSFQQFAQAYSQDPSQYQGWEITIDGNKVNNVPIAGRISLSRLLAGSGSGVIGSVNYDGTMQILGGPLLRVNTPNGVFATAYTSKPFLTADEQNPSVCSFSGYPMCIPRSASDPDCPASNRPANGALVYTPANTSAMAPFLPGDMVTWDGVKNGAHEVLAYAVVAENVQQLTTADSGDPVYVRVEDVGFPVTVVTDDDLLTDKCQIIVGVDDGTVGTEFATSKYVGYLSDSTATVTVHRLDTDPCTGEETEVQVASGTVKAGDVRNKFDIRVPDAGKISTVAREYRVRASKGAKTVAKGILAGQYVSPITELIWPEVNVPGTPWPANAFNLIGGLKNGIVQDNQQFGQLKPWPGATAPTPVKTCTGKELNPAPASPSATQCPIADAGPSLTGQLAGSLVTFTGKNTNPVLADTDLTFAWTGPSDITINNAAKPTMNLVIPWQDPTTTPSSTRNITLKICLIADPSQCSTNVTQLITNKFVDKVTITSYTYASKNGGSIAVSASSNNVLRSKDGANLQIQISGGAWVNMVQDTSNAAIYSYSRTSAGKQPSSIGVRSIHNSTPVTTTALVKRAWRKLRGQYFAA